MLLCTNSSCLEGSLAAKDPDLLHHCQPLIFKISAGGNSSNRSVVNSIGGNLDSRFALGRYLQRAENPFLSA